MKRHKQRCMLLSERSHAQQAASCCRHSRTIRTVGSVRTTAGGEEGMKRHGPKDICSSETICVILSRGTRPATLKTQSVELAPWIRHLLLQVLRT